MSIAEKLAASSYMLVKTTCIINGLNKKISDPKKFHELCCDLSESYINNIFHYIDTKIKNTGEFKNEDCENAIDYALNILNQNVVNLKMNSC